MAKHYEDDEERLPVWAVKRKYLISSVRQRVALIIGILIFMVFLIVVLKPIVDNMTAREVIEEHDGVAPAMITYSDFTNSLVLVIVACIILLVYLYIVLKVWKKEEIETYDLYEREAK